MAPGLASARRLKFWRYVSGLEASGPTDRKKRGAAFNAVIDNHMTPSTLQSVSAAPPRVAIVGGGIGGAATAHFLLALRPDVRIDLFEASEKVGGRAHTLDAKIFGVPIDGGATSIFSKNKYLVSFVEKFGLAKAQDSGKDVIGLWDGRGFRFKWPDTSLLPARILARYGLSPLHVIAAVNEAVDRLDAIYDLQARNQSFASPEALFDRLNLTSLTQRSARSYLEDDLKVSARFVDEFVDGASRDNYNQDADVNAFVDLVSLAGAGIGGSVFTLANGTTPLVDALLSSSSQIAVHLSSPVAYISSAAAAHGLTVGLAGGVPEAAQTYDAVALAAPLEHASGLQLSGPRIALNTSRPYQRTCVTFVAGQLDAAYFGLRAVATPPTDVLTVQNASLPFSTLAVHATLNNGTQIFKLFSKRPLEEAVLDQIFATRHRTRRLDWQAAYPKLNPTPSRTTWPPFDVPLSVHSRESEVAGGANTAAAGRPLIYVSAMESAVSCMETQLISAKNAALRIASQLKDDGLVGMRVGV